MAVKGPMVSTLNPHAALFVPAAYMDTEDFSPEWWRLVENCPAFRDYWLRENEGMEEELGGEDLEMLLEEMELIEAEEGMDFDEAVYYNNNGDNKDQQQDQCLAKDLRGLDLNSDDSPKS